MSSQGASADGQAFAILELGASVIVRIKATGNAECDGGNGGQQAAGCEFLGQVAGSGE